ncbi:MAG: alpha/beta hydrolase [Bacteroidetes bacterium]|nr:alpha/beta hydrolase [Bacteroidota bacterium]
MLKKIILFLISCLSIKTSSSQTESRLIGIWEGKIKVGTEIRAIFHFERDSSGNILGGMDSPDQGAKNIPCSDIRLIGDSIFLKIPSLNGSYAGLLADSATINGRWKQGMSFNLNLKKVDKVAGLNRPQNPQPPFPYSSQDIEYDNADRTMHYGATITIPQGKGPFPAVLLITGSGPQNRDEELMEHKPFAVLADYLTRRGVVVLRVDDRGVGKSNGNFSKSTTADFAVDAGNSLDYLKSRPEVNLKKIGLIGHSEGGMIAPMVAVKRKEIDFIILLAGPGEKISKLMEDQNAALYRSAGINEKAIQSFTPFFQKMITIINESNDVSSFDKKIKPVLNEWRKNEPPAHVLATTGIFNDSTQQIFIDAMNNTMFTPWFRYFIRFDPQIYLSQVHCKVLALNGEKDIQVASKPNLAAIKYALQKAGNKKYEIVEIPKLNHLFQTCKACTVTEYGQLEETISPVALNLVGDWIDKNVK